MKPILFTLGTFHVFAFGFFLALAFVFSTYIVWKISREDLLEEEYLDAYLYANIAGLLSARILYILLNFHEFGWNVLKFIIFRNAPGLSLFGALLGGATFLYYYSKKHKLKFAKVTDTFSVAASFSLSLISLGEFIGGAHFGRVSSLPWAIAVPGLSGRRHPVEIYGVLLFFVLFMLLRFLYQKFHRSDPGLLSYFFIFGLSVIVFILEFVKEARVYLVHVLSLNQVFAISAIFVISIPILKVLFTKIKKNTDVK